MKNYNKDGIRADEMEQAQEAIRKLWGYSGSVGYKLFPAMEAGAGEYLKRTDVMNALQGIPDLPDW